MGKRGGVRGGATVLANNVDEELVAVERNMLTFDASRGEKTLPENMYIMYTIRINNSLVLILV